MEENHMGWKLVKGVRQDVINLFKLFTKTNSLRYEDFCKVWKEMKFSLIYRYAFIELLEFTEEVIQIVKEYLLPIYEFHTRVAAVYTLYGLYFKQPIREAAKIRLTKSEWEELHSLISHCKEGKHYDIVYIHLKMYLAGAYIFVATPRTAGFERGFRKYSEKRSTILPSNCDIELLYRPLISEDLVSSLTQLESLYCRKKAELLGKNNLTFIDGEFAKTLQEDLKKYADECLQGKAASGADKNIINQEIEDEEENEGVIRTRLKTKSYKSGVVNGEVDSTEKSEPLNQRKRLGSKFLELTAKKKAEYYIRKLREECSKQQNESSLNQSSFDLPELDSS